MYDKLLSERRYPGGKASKYSVPLIFIGRECNGTRSNVERDTPTLKVRHGIDSTYLVTQPCRKANRQAIRQALKDSCSLGEVCGAMRDVFGEYQPQA